MRNPLPESTTQDKTARPSPPQNDTGADSAGHCSLRQQNEASSCFDAQLDCPVLTHRRPCAHSWCVQNYACLTVCLMWWRAPRGGKAGCLWMSRSKTTSGEPTMSSQRRAVWLLQDNHCGRSIVDDCFWRDGTITHFVHEPIAPFLHEPWEGQRHGGDAEPESEHKPEHHAQPNRPTGVPVEPRGLRAVRVWRR